MKLRILLCALSSLFVYQGVNALNFGLVVLGFLCLLIVAKRPKASRGMPF